MHASSIATNAIVRFGLLMMVNGRWWSNQWTVWGDENWFVYVLRVVYNMWGVFFLPRRVTRIMRKDVIKHVLNTWRIVFTYHIRNYLVPFENNDLKVRLQLSTLLNRINHHCSPNSYAVCYFSSYRTFREPIAYVKAVRDIAIGDEITYSYIHPKFLQEDVRTRQKEILDCYDFICSCSRCGSEISPISPQTVWRL